MKPLFALLVTALLLGGCQLIGGPGEIAGSLTDVEGAPVRGAAIFIDNQPAGLSSPNGTFTIRDVSPGIHVVKAELRIGSVNYRGRNHVVVYAEERSTSIGLVMGPVSQLGSMRGTVRDTFGTPLESVRVFAGGPLNSWMDVTDSNGRYQIDDLVGGFDYTVTASGRGYENDTRTFAAVAGQTRIQDFALRLSSGQSQNGVKNLGSVAWTSPVNPDRRPTNGAFERIKQLVDTRMKPREAGMRPMQPVTQHIEVDLYWDYQFYSELLAYGIYRGTNPTGALQPLDVLRDPLASFYADISDFLLPGVRYYYQVSRLNTDYPTLGGESPLSADTSAMPLSDLNLIDPFFTSVPNFRWSGVPNATSYSVYVFSYYPDYQAIPIWTSAPTSFTNLAYGGPALTPGARYYYVVVGSGFSGGSHSISPIDSFIAP
jgi:hypothetical protein